MTEAEINDPKNTMIEKRGANRQHKDDPVDYEHAELAGATHKLDMRKLRKESAKAGAKAAAVAYVLAGAASFANKYADRKNAARNRGGTLTAEEIEKIGADAGEE